MKEFDLMQAAKFWQEGLTGKEIAAHFGIGRYKFQAIRANNREKFPIRARDRKLASGKNAASILQAIMKPLEVKERMPPKASNCNGVPAPQWTTSMCCFPLWGDHERFNYETSLYCGGERHGDHRYCEFHAHITSGRGTVSEQNASKLTKKMMRA